MATGKTDSLRSSLTRTILWVVATTVAASVAVREYHRTAEADAARSEAAILTARAVAATYTEIPAQHGDGPGAVAEQFCTRLLREPFVQAVCFFDESGDVLHAASRDNAAVAASADVVVRPGTCRDYSVPGVAETAKLVDIPLEHLRVRENAPDDERPTLRMLILVPHVMVPWYQRLWMFIAPLLAVGAVGSGVGLWRMHRSVLGPLDRLQRLLEESDHDADLPAGAHPHEIAAIVQALRTLRDDRNHWRTQAESSARAVHAQVAQQTRQIYRDLRRAQREIYTDPLTGVNNRRVLRDRFGDIFTAQRDAGQDLSLLMFDVDHFKTLNDSKGHLAGDELLRFTAELIRGALRDTDIAIRYGGDEFVVLLPSVNADEAEAIARRIVALFGQRAMLFSGLPQRPGLSAGVASLWKHQPRSADELLEMADRALYEAKASGKQDVCCFHGTLAAAPRSPRSVTNVPLPKA